MALSPKDWKAWQNYQTGFASKYTKEYIEKLDCSDEMKMRIAINVCSYQPGGELPSSSSSTYHGDDWRYL